LVIVQNNKKYTVQVLR